VDIYVRPFNLGGEHWRRGRNEACRLIEGDDMTEKGKVGGTTFGGKLCATRQKGTKAGEVKNFMHGVPDWYGDQAWGRGECL